VLVLFVDEKVLINDFVLADFSFFSHFVGNLCVVLFIFCSFAEYDTAENSLAKQIFSLVAVPLP